MQKMRLLFWGTYDKGKPRNRILLSGLRASGADVKECHIDVWRNVEDKSRVSNKWAWLWLTMKWLVSYPILIARYLLTPRHDAVLVGYMGQLDVILLWPFAKLRGVPIVFDALMSLYNAVVEDRGLLSPKNPLARVLYAWEWLSCRAADAVVVNTNLAREYWIERFGVPPQRLHAILTGAETDAFPLRPCRPNGSTDGGAIRVLFYGTFIPLHGISTVIEAARIAEHENIEWRIIGSGQEEKVVRLALREHPLPRVTWIPWVPYEHLVDHIHQADVCLGIFGETERAGWSIPNKIFQVLSTGTPIVTRDSPGIRDLLAPDAPGVYLIPPADAQALVAAIRRFAEERGQLSGQHLHRDAVRAFQPAAIGEKLIALARTLC